MNLPNKLSILRVILVPVFVAVLVVPFELGLFAEHEILVRIIAAAVFLITALTDMLDGKIARKYNLITDFGKFIDPLADKFMVFGALIALLYVFENIQTIFIWAALIVIFRELAITSLRLLISKSSGKVVAAAWLGKVKTVTQVVCIMTILLEPVVLPFDFMPKLFSFEIPILSFVTIIVMTVMTLWSGIDYFRCYWDVIDPTK